MPKVTEPGGGEEIRVHVDLISNTVLRVQTLPVKNPGFQTPMGLPLDPKGFLNFGVIDIWSQIICCGRWGPSRALYNAWSHPWCLLTRCQQHPPQISLFTDKCPLREGDRITLH